MDPQEKAVQAEPGFAAMSDADLLAVTPEQRRSWPAAQQARFFAELMVRALNQNASESAAEKPEQ